MMVMASLTYCWKRCIGSLASNYRQAHYKRLLQLPQQRQHDHHHHQHRRRYSTPHRPHQQHHHHHHLQQIVFLIITFVVYVSGIRNTASSSQQHFQNGLVAGDFNNQTPQQQQLSANFQPMMPSNYEFQRPITPPPPAPPPEATSFSTLQQQQQAQQPVQQKEFRPSEQIFEFTLSDAAPMTTNYPPSYLPSNTNPDMANKRYQQVQEEDETTTRNTQFAFPTEMASSLTSGGNNIFSYRQQSATYTAAPPQQTTPIFTYKDPFTNEKYQAALRRPIGVAASALPLPVANDDDTNLIYYGNHQYQGDVAAQSAYTVQSSLLVGGNAHRGDSHRPLISSSSSANDYKRPGYVFDEQIQPNYISSSSNTNKQYSNREQPTTQRLSYDSHDYPPPSYHERPGYQQQHQQQHQHQQPSTYFQSPQRQDIGIQPISQASMQSINYQPASTATFPFPPPPRAPPRLPASSSLSPSSLSASNYANNFGNYLLADAQHQYQHQPHYPSSPHQYAGSQGNYNPHQQHQQQQQHHQQHPQRPPSNYYQYQLGEIPPPRPNRPTPPPPPYPNYHNYVGQRPPPPPPPPPPQSGLASLATLFTTTQQYAPQFTNLLLGAFTGGGGGDGGSSSASSFRPQSQLQLQQQQQRPLNMQLIKALENIARNDDLQCVPKVLCQTIAGQTQRGQLPSFITSPAITNFLAGFPAASPALIYGRAALLGISGGERSCAQTYEKCPKNEYEILYYLNNHRGGFFKFFNEPEEQATAAGASSNGNGNYDDSGASDSGYGSGSGGGSDGGGVSSSLFSILTALTGNPMPAKPKITTTTTQRPEPTTLDVAGGIGNFFTQVLSNYLSGVEHQRRRRRRSIKTEIELDNDDDDDEENEDADESGKILNDEDFHDDEDNEDTEEGEQTNEANAQFDDVEARILNKDEIPADYPKFFPQDEEPKEQAKTFNKQNGRKLKFPSSQVDERDPGKLGVSWVSFVDSLADAEDQNYEATTFKSKRRGKKFNSYDHDQAHNAERIIFPDHYEQHIRKGRILNRPSYAAHYGDYVRATAAAAHDEGFVLANNQRQPHYQAYEQSNTLTSGQAASYFASSATSASSHYSSQSSSSSFGSGNGFRPTPLPSTGSNNFVQSYQNGNSHSNGYKGYRGSNYSGSNSASLYAQSQNNYHHQNNYNYPNNNYVSNNRYSSNYQRTTPTTTTTRRPRHEDDPNVYVNNGNGITEYYITPDGRKIYLRNR